MIRTILFLLVIPLFLYSKTLTFAAINFPPYIYFEKEEVKGFNVEILNTIFSQMGITIQYKQIPWARAMILLKSGEIDALFPMVITKERLNFIDFSDSFTSEPFALFVKQDSKIQYKGKLEDLSSYTFGRVRGYSSGAFFDSAVQSGIINLTESINSEQNISKFLKGRFDILVDNKYYILYQLKKLHKSKEIKILTPLLANTKAYLGFSKKRQHKPLIKEFNRILQQIKNNGTYDAIIHKYFHD